MLWEHEPGLSASNDFLGFPKLHQCIPFLLENTAKKRKELVYCDYTNELIAIVLCFYRVKNGVLSVHFSILSYGVFSCACAETIYS